VQPGLYRLRSKVDPDDVVDEAQEVNPDGFTTSPVAVPGYRAKPRAATVRAGATTRLRLAADAFDHPGFRSAPFDDGWHRGPVEFKVVDPPDHGTLDVPVGTWLSDPEVVYTPDAGTPQGDTFTFVARDATAPGFPTAPAAAAVTLSAGDAPAPVAISGAPARMVESTSVQLTASEPVTWSATAGSITPDGLFTAPAGAGTAVVRAEAALGEVRAVSIAIDPAPAVQGIPAAPIPEPVVETPGPAAPVTPPATAPRAAPRIPTLRVSAIERGPNVATSVRVLRPGRVRVSLLSGARVVRSCLFRAVRGRTYACRFKAPRGTKPLRVSAVLTSPGRAALGKTVAVAAEHHH
jgi:hypothetical protein